MSRVFLTTTPNTTWVSSQLLWSPSVRLEDIAISGWRTEDSSNIHQIESERDASELPRDTLAGKSLATLVQLRIAG